MNITLISQHELTVRPSAHQAATRSCTTDNPIATPSPMAWLGGFGSKVNTSAVFASKRPTSRPLAEVLT